MGLGTLSPVLRWSLHLPDFAGLGSGLPRRASPNSSPVYLHVTVKGPLQLRFHTWLTPLDHRAATVTPGLFIPGLLVSKEYRSISSGTWPARRSWAVRPVWSTSP